MPRGRRLVVPGVLFLTVVAALGVQLYDAQPFGWEALGGLVVAILVGLWLRGRAAGFPRAAGLAVADVTRGQDLATQLNDVADRDPTTGLWNRSRFQRDLAHQLDRCRRYDERAALVLMDVDGIKQVTDVLGHLAGDRVRCALGDALSAGLRSSDRVGRLSGDEYALLLLDVDDAAVKRITTTLTGDMLAVAGEAQDCISLSINVGSTPLGDLSGGVEEALRAATASLDAGRRRPDTRPADSDALRSSTGVTSDIESLGPMLAAVNARDVYTEMNSRAVVTLARGIAIRLGLDDAQTSEVEHVALLHDLGMSTVPDAILHKASALTRAEQTVLLQHPAAGAKILLSMPALAHLAPAVRAEHERWDGGGYPDGLAGEQIPIASRIALVCDAYQAMTTDRPYRRAMSVAAAHDEIRRETGAQFCPRAAAAMFEVHLEDQATAGAGAVVDD